MRRFAHSALRWTVSICLVVIGVVGYVDSVLLDEDAFAERIRVALDNDDVQRGLAAQAVDLAFDQFDADALLAEALPEEARLAATPLLELSKPAVARAGAELLGVAAVDDAVETAARSIHRQTTRAILATDEVDVTINTRPILVVTADAIIGPAGARAAVALDLPAEATSIELGSNQSAPFAAIRLLGWVTAIAGITLLLAVIGYFATAANGTRLTALKRLGRTMLYAGATVAAIGGLIGVAVGVVIEAALANDEAISFGTLSLGGGTSNGGAALASVLFDPIVGSGRRTIINGLALIAIGYLFGPSRIASALRSMVRSRDPVPVVRALADWSAQHLRRMRWWIGVTYALLLILWPQPTLRVTITLSALALGAHLLLTIGFSPRAPWAALRSILELPHLVASDRTTRSDRAEGWRRMALLVLIPLALVWPDYGRDGLITLGWTIAVVSGLLYWWEDRPNRQTEDASERASDLKIQQAQAGEPKARWSGKRKVIVGLAALASFVFVVVPGQQDTIRAASPAYAADGPVMCNGSAELCDRSFAEVTFAGTHNSMSAAELGWEVANHETAIPAQLAGGIRALLIDVQRWEVDVNLSELDFDPAAAEIAASALSNAQVPEDGLWMCHKLCQLGGTPFGDFLADLRVFLDTHPDEVVVVVIQDDAPARDIMAAIESADLVSSALNHQPGAPWPTLGEMIETGERLVFFAENDGDPTSWYQPAYEGNVDETGYEFAIVEDFDCSANRGRPGSPLFLINHWVETGLPIPAEADTVNSAAVLRARIDECQQVRGRNPSIVAVNFWERGDLIEVVDSLNQLAE